MTSLKQDKWGNRSLQLDLSAARIMISGLSNHQVESLKQDYSGFVTKSEDNVYADIICFALKQSQNINVSKEELTVDEIYCPRKIRKAGNEFTLTGINFESVIRVNETQTLTTLSVKSEEELVLPGVFENYLRVISAHHVLRWGGAVLHSAGLVFDEKAYIFSGRSNTGKTTLTRKAFAKGARVLSDDINLVLPASDRDGYDAYAVPFTGEFGRTLDHAGSKESYPVAGIVLLQQSDCLQTYLVNQSAAVARLLTGCPFVNTDEHESDALFDSITGLVSKVPVIRLLSRKDDDIDDIMAAVKKQFAAL